jgi:hypothetical protein
MLLEVSSPSLYAEDIMGVKKVFLDIRFAK